MANLSFSLNDFIRDRDKTYWILRLDNGQEIYQDDTKDGLEDRAWLRAKKYIQDNGLKIESMSLCFRSNRIHIDFPEHDAILYSVIATGIACPEEVRTYSSYRIGHLNGDTAYYTVYRVPELVYETEGSFPKSTLIEDHYIYDGSTNNNRRDNEELCEVAEDYSE